MQNLIVANVITNFVIIDKQTFKIISPATKPAICAAPPGFTLSTKTGLSPETCFKYRLEKNKIKNS